ncbi:unnamed protein product [Mytilus edulis]|uniref:Uncharacterized protein n=1 Tax=Mytilus edulis TaxID=6550 RepID=A0A8S3UYC2_MYTED|nr:unnamed protein product [Mytilus edulis]
MNRSLLTCVFTALVVILTFTDAIPPPVWPSAFSINFSEICYLSFITLYQNDGTLYYNYYDKQARFDHNRGQGDFFCMFQRLSEHDKKAPCQVLFSNDTNLYVHYPEAKTCCRVCGTDHACGVLKPDWLKNGTYLGSEIVNGTKCNGWETPGYAFMDSWYLTDANIPCLYHEKSDHIGAIHNMTFNQKSFTLGAPNPDIFNVPSYCHRQCPWDPFHPIGK